VGSSGIVNKKFCFSIAQTFERPRVSTEMICSEKKLRRRKTFENLK